MYEPYLHALSRFLYMEVPPWILAKEITDNWKTSAWGRISGLSRRDLKARTTTPTEAAPATFCEQSKLDVVLRTHATDTLPCRRKPVCYNFSFIGP